MIQSDSIPSDAQRGALRAAFRRLVVAAIGTVIAFTASAIQFTARANHLMWLASVGGMITLIGILLCGGAVVGRIFEYSWA